MTFPEMIHGSKPDLPEFKATDPIEELQKLLRGEISSWDDITALSDLFQEYMMGAYEKAIPGFGDILKLGAEDTKSLLGEAAPLIKGEIPEDVKGQVMRSAAFQNLMSGGGDQFLQSLQARDLGLTSLDLMKQGANLLTAGGNSAQQWQNIAGKTILPPTANMYSPEWFANFTAQQRADAWKVKAQQKMIDAMPDPVVSGITGTVMNLVGAYLGAGRGGGGGNMLATTDGMDYGSFAGTSAGEAGMTTPEWQSNVGSLLGSGYGGGDGSAFNYYKL